MVRDISEKFDLALTLFEDKEVVEPSWKPMQGRVDTNFRIRLQKGGEIVSVTSGCKIVAKFFCYDPTSPTVLRRTYEINYVKPDGTPNPDYNIKIESNEVVIPANIVMADYAGNIKMTLIIECAGIDGRSISIPYYYLYSVTPLAGYKEVGSVTSVSEFAKVDLSNTANSVFLQKAIDAGVGGGAMTGDAIVAALEGQSGDERLDASAVKNIPTMKTTAEIIMDMEALTDDKRLDAKAIKGLPTYAQIARGLELLQGEEKLDTSAIKNFENAILASIPKLDGGNANGN